MVLIALLFFVSAKLLDSNVVYAWNKNQLKDLVARSIIRAEYATDLAVTAMADIQIEGLTTCSKETVEAFREHIFSAGNIKNIHLQTAQQNCSGFSSEEMQKNFDSEEYWINGRASNIQFYALPDKKQGIMRIKWELNDYNLMATVSVGGLLYDMVPASLRADLGIKLLLINGKEISSYLPDNGDRVKEDKVNPSGQLMYEASSKRYPVKAYIEIDEAALWALGNNQGKVFDILVALAGLVLGLLISRVLFPPLGFVGELDEALANEEFHPHFQPIVSLNSHKIVGFEMLARWTKPNGEKLSAGYFIPLAENLGKIDAILFSLLRSAGKEVGAELRKNPNLKLTFNVTPRQFLDAIFLKRLISVVTKADLPLGSLVVEITERQQLADLDQAVEIVACYRQNGIRIAIDDAGTGHNGLSSIQKLDADTMKLDKMFIDGIVDDERSRQMVTMLAKLARQYQMTMIAEGIETAEQAALAQALGIQEGQGFYFFHPVSSHKLVGLLNFEAKEQRADRAPVPKEITEELLAKAL